MNDEIARIDLSALGEFPGIVIVIVSADALAAFQRKEILCLFVKVVGLGMQMCVGPPVIIIASPLMVGISLKFHHRFAEEQLDVSQYHAFARCAVAANADNEVMGFLVNGIAADPEHVQGVDRCKKSDFQG